MNLAELQERMDQAAELALPLFYDTCRILSFTSTPDGFGGSTEVTTTVASDVPCFYEAFSRPIEMTVGGAPITSLTHKIVMEATAATRLVKSDYQIVVAARDDKPAFTFERPVVMDGSFTFFVEVAAVLAQ